jgi:hypothetical protein
MESAGRKMAYIYRLSYYEPTSEEGHRWHKGEEIQSAAIKKGPIRSLETALFPDN